MLDLKKLRAIADAARLFGPVDAFREGEEGHGFATVYADHEGENYDVFTIDTWQYDAPNFAMILGEFYATFNAKQVLELIDALETARTQQPKEQSNG